MRQHSAVDMSQDFQGQIISKKGLFKKGIMTAKMRLARCFLVLLALKTKGFTSFLRDTKGTLSPAISRKIKQLKNRKMMKGIAIFTEEVYKKWADLYEGTSSSIDG
jgi:hypothetical protein